MADARSGQDALEVRLRNGDADALAELFSQHRERLWRMVNFRLDRRLAARIDPEDILQEAYIGASNRLRHFPPDSWLSPFGWLRKITHRTLVDVHRRHMGAGMRDAAREVPVAGMGFGLNTSASLVIQLVGHLTSPSQAAQRAEMVRMVEDTIEGMDPLDREVLALRHFEELTNGEVAEALDIQIKAASIRYVRALKRLKDALATLPGLAIEVPND